RDRPGGAVDRQRLVLPHLVPARTEVGRWDGADPAQHDRRARARAPARATTGQGHPVQRASRQGEGGPGLMNLALSDEQVLLREAARGSLSRHKTIEAAREALEDPGALPDLWSTAVEAGWPGLLIDEEHGGAGLGVFEAMLVAEEGGRVLGSCPRRGLVSAAAMLNAAGDESLEAVARGELRAAYVPARPPGEREPGWTVEPKSGLTRAQAPRAVVEGDEVVLDGTVAFVPDAPGAELLVAIGEAQDGSPVAAA